MTRRSRGLAWVLGVLVAGAVAAFERPARAFPGVLVTADGAARHVTSSSLVLMQHGGISIVTLMVESEGPLKPFALVLPVPSDVALKQVKTLRRGILGRVEAVSAPRFHAFYEQDPCDSADTEQAWEERIKARGPGFLAPPGLPPLDKHYAVSNDISVPVEPVFKDQASEFRYGELRAKEAAALGAELGGRGYRASDAALDRLAAAAHSGMKLLFAEVLLERVELAAGDRVQLGGIRFVTRKPLGALLESIGAANGGSNEELFVYVFDRRQRYELANAENAFPPLSVSVKSRAAERFAAVYNGVFDAFTARHPAAFVTEYAWSTAGCGQPCPDVPLAPDELLTLGGDVLEVETASAAERQPDPGDEPVLDRERFDSHLSELMPKERPAAVREHLADRKEIERRRALAARQTYVLTRLHHRYAPSLVHQDLELRAAPPLRGGVGVPKGAAGELSGAATPALENQLEVRFVALEPWTRAFDCGEPRRFRWGKRWASEARTPRAVPLAVDLASASRDVRFVREVLKKPIPELGLALPASDEAPAASSSAPSPAGSVSADARVRDARRSCGVGLGGGESASGAGVGLLLALVGLGLGRARLRRPTLPPR